MDAFDIAVVGRGLAGSLTALSLGRKGYRVALVGPRSPRADGRTTALMDPSLGILKDLGLWPAVAPIATPLRAIRIIDGTGRLVRAPTVTFRAAEIGLEAFGCNLPNARLLQVLDDAIAALPAIEAIEASLERLETTAEGAMLVLDSGRTFAVALVVGADGRSSSVRAGAGIGMRAWSYPQTALVMNFAHAQPHEGISTEFHTEEGPFTQVPLAGNRSSLVWVRRPENAAALLELSPEALRSAIETRMQSMLGRVTEVEGVQSFPLSGMTARRFGTGRAVLVGEAAHAFPPIGAQGLNLGLRDAVALTDLLGDRGAVPIDPATGDRYDIRRRADILSRTASVDLLNRSLLSGFLPVQIARSAGLHLLSAIPPLRAFAMHEGVSPGGAFRALRQTLRERISRKQA